ncbi:MAG TPA: nitrite/sulfite reductase [Gemmatimonadales bacterium]|nr:nitrite/sulfite reductase [Gemmatimonadales bacterium]
MAEAITREHVLRRNSIERLKVEKFPLDILAELPVLATRSYEAVPEEDIVRLKWYGLYHDKPKTGFFMLRVKSPGGLLTPAKLRTIARLSVELGREYAEITTRQNIQLHWLELRHMPEVFARLTTAGFNQAGACGDTVRNITGCPVAGLDAAEAFDATPVLREAARFFDGNPDYADLPRKLKITVTACPHQCTVPEINCIALVPLRHMGRDGFAVRVGGGLASVPRLSKGLGVFVEPKDAVPVLAAILDVWKETLKYRMSRVKARLKFMMDDVGPEEFRRLIEERLGRRLEDGPLPAPLRGGHEPGVHPQRQAGLNYIAVPVTAGLVRGSQLLRLADLAERLGGEIRLTREQNFILTHVSAEALPDTISELEAIGFPLELNGMRATSVACTGSPLCNFAVSLTKPRLVEIMDRLEASFGKQVEGLRINLDGCPHACAQHWIGDIGLQGTTLRERTAEGEKQEAYDLYLRGGQGVTAAIGVPLVRRVAAGEVGAHVERLVRLWLGERSDAESFKSFTDRQSDERLVAVAAEVSIEEARSRLRRRDSRAEVVDV